MSNPYVDGKVREAIMAAKGSRTNAQKLLMAWAAEDPDLLRGIAQPFLKAIAAAAIERAARPAASGGGAARARGGGAAAGGARPSASGLSRDALENLLDRLGREDDGGSPQTAAARPSGAQAGGAARPPGGQGGGGGQGGVTHEKAMMAIAKAFVAKKVR